MNPDRNGSRRAQTGIRRAGLLPFLLGLAILPIAVGVINYTPLAGWLVGPLLRPDTAGSADVIVVLGAGVMADCSPNLNAVRRVLLAARLYRERRAPLVMFSGGRSPDGPPCAVGAVMAEFAESVGVPRTSIRTETTSTTTWENALHSAPLLSALGARRLLLVTDRLHMMRSEASFARFSFVIERATVSMRDGYVDNVRVLYHAARESIAIRYYASRGWIRSPWSSAHLHEPNDAVPLRVRQDPMRPRVDNPHGPYVILGASYAGGWQVESLAGAPVVNKGVAGQVAFDLLRRFDADVVAHRPRAVLLWGYINDIFRSTRGNVVEVEEGIKRSYEEMVARSLANGIEPILIAEVTIRHPNTVIDNAKATVGGWLGRDSYQAHVNERVLHVNGWLRDLARRNGLLLVDIQAILSDVDGRRLREYAISDGSHLSEAGYRAITRYVTPILEAHNRER